MRIPKTAIHPSFRHYHRYSRRSITVDPLTSIPEAPPIAPGIPRPQSIRKPICKIPVSLGERVEELTREVGILKEDLRRKNEVIRRLEQRIRRQIEMKNTVLWTLHQQKLEEEMEGKGLRRRQSSPNVMTMVVSERNSPRW